MRLAESFLRSLQGAYDPVFEIVPQIKQLGVAAAEQPRRLRPIGTVTQTDFQSALR